MKASCAISVVALAASATASLYGESNLNHTCVLDTPFLSCSPQANPATVDTCCVETFGGLFLQTQFWDTWTGLEDEGQLLPSNTWTIHGLWPDFCNGSFTQYCDFNRQFDPFPSPNTTNGEPDGTPIPPYKGGQIHPWRAFGKQDLKAYMDTNWINQRFSNYDLWIHEFSKHATCYSTFDVPCYGPQYVLHEDVIQFFETVILYYKRLPTFHWLAAHDIRPSNTTSYTLSDMEAALTQEYGMTPFLGCAGPRFNETAAGAGSDDDGGTSLNEVWYYFHAFGRPQDGAWKPTRQTGSSTCAKAKGAVRYLERTPSSVRGAK